MRVILLALAGLPWIAVQAVMLLRGSPKVAEDLQEAFKTNKHVDIMVTMKKSTDEVEAVAGKTQSYMQNLQAFTEKAQKPVKDLLTSHPHRFNGKPTFFWITNSVSIPQASSELVSDIAKIDGVEEIRLPVVGRIQGGHRGQ
ncbi:unnamed protein product [Aphanomyces euteiches]|uniref:FtsX extracellular domain-containing protein n=1 Tax=Aphanomyces euteiches TaxID=100861 RepID=A0A6G0XVB2_9STRA|nr:hypothetical protein Ae201684_000833 [Aphanomyces euteiches]KAH9100071.1 hypothetical protein Ae201684P_019072 [Aphanomyces euteiches]KAH9146127.1 hypothetical protein AeRB84_010007 [Aphanomyces euteiches]